MWFRRANHLRKSCEKSSQWKADGGCGSYRRGKRSSRFLLLLMLVLLGSDNIAPLHAAQSSYRSSHVKMLARTKIGLSWYLWQGFALARGLSLTRYNLSVNKGLEDGLFSFAWHGTPSWWLVFKDCSSNIRLPNIGKKSICVFRSVNCISRISLSFRSCICSRPFIWRQYRLYVLKAYGRVYRTTGGRRWSFFWLLIHGVWNLSCSDIQSRMSRRHAVLHGFEET